MYVATKQNTKTVIISTIVATIIIIIIIITTITIYYTDRRSLSYLSYLTIRSDSLSTAARVATIAKLLRNYCVETIVVTNFAGDLFTW